MKKKPTTPLMARKIMSIRATGLMPVSASTGTKKLQTPRHNRAIAEREPLRRGPQHGGEHLLRPRLVEGLSGQGGTDAEEEDVREDDRGGERETRKARNANTCMTAPTPHMMRRARSLRSLKGMKIRTTPTSVRMKLRHCRATLAAWLCAPRVLRM